MSFKENTKEKENQAPETSELEKKRLKKLEAFFCAADEEEKAARNKKKRFKIPEIVNLYRILTRKRPEKERPEESYFWDEMPKLKVNFVKRADWEKNRGWGKTAGWEKLRKLLRLEKMKRLKEQKNWTVWNPDFQSLNLKLPFQWKKSWQKKALAFVTIMAVIGVAYYQYLPRSLSATSYWTQTDWSGGASSDTKTHPDSPPGSWTKYSSKDSSLVVANGGADLQLSLLPGSITQTNNGTGSDGFNLTGKNLNQTEVVNTGTGNDASINLALTESFNTGNGADGAITISTAKNINTDLKDGLTNRGRTCADGRGWRQLCSNGHFRLKTYCFHQTISRVSC